MDFTNKGVNSTPEITSEIAMAAYELIKEYGTADLAMKNQSDSSIEPEHFKIVDKEGDRLLAEITSKEAGTFIIEPAYPATYTEDGEIDEAAVPAVYFDESNSTNLIASLSSDLLDVSIVYGDK